ncbi:MAG: hypothetical protein J07HQX50_00312 [Haloquadratum sp. J07HQX50]|nr:MAG: hypothetical protein J07HQX50_00312 [Haloquadratum sp. J07HQX50]
MQTQSHLASVSDALPRTHGQERYAATATRSCSTRQSHAIPIPILSATRETSDVTSGGQTQHQFMIETPPSARLSRDLRFNAGGWASHYCRTDTNRSVRAWPSCQQILACSVVVREKWARSISKVDNMVSDSRIHARLLCLYHMLGS